jgi:predicted kinase
MTEKFAEFISEGVNDPGIFKAVFLAGGPGSGKSFMVGKTALSTFGLRPINSDDVFEAALRKAEMAPTPENIYSEKGQSMRQQAKYLTQKKLSLSVIGRLGLVIDGTGKDVAKIQRQMTTLKSIGYDVAMIFVNTDIETALERNNARQRTLPDNVVKKMWSDVQNNMGAFQRMFRNEMIIVDNSSDSNVDANTLSAYRQIQQFVRSPVRNHKAREWITNAQKQAMREEAVEQLELIEKLKASDPMGDWIDDFYKSDAPQFKGKSKAKRRQMAIAAKLDAMEEKTEVPQDKDIAKRKGSQPAKYHKGLSKSTKKARDAQFKRQSKMSDSDPKAYKPAPGDKTAKTKPSKYTKYVDKMMSEIIDDVSEACWDTHKQVGMKKKGNKMVPNCVPKTEEAEERDSMTLPQIGKLRNVKKRVSKQRTKTKTFDKIKIEEELLAEISMSDKIKAKTLHKQDYEKAANLLKKIVDRKKKETGGRLRHSVGYYAVEVLRTISKGEKLNARILSTMVEGYNPDTMQWGKPEGTEHMKSVTPGETPKKKKKEEVNEEDGKQCGDGMYYCRQRKACVAIPEGYKDRGDGFIVRENVQDVLADIKKFWELADHSKPEIGEPMDFTLTDEDIQDMMNQADHLTIDDMIELGMYSPDEIETFEIDPDDVHADVEITEALTPLGRIKRRQAARRNKQKLKVARARAMRKSATPDKIKMRATRGARGMMYKRLLRGRDKGSLPPAEKARLEVMIKRFQPLIARLAVRMVPQMRKNELNRLKKRGAMTSQKAKKFKISKGGSASKYKAKKFKIKKAGK